MAARKGSTGRKRGRPAGKKTQTRKKTASTASVGMEAEIINANLTVKVRGPVGQISKLTEEDIVVEVDFTNAEVGTATYKANIRFAEGFEGVGALKTNSVSAMVQLQGG